MAQATGEQDLVDFEDVKDSLKTGDLLLLYRKDEKIPNYAVIINNSDHTEYFPLLMVKGVAKPMQKETFLHSKRRYLTAVTAVVRIFYGDYERVAICRLKTSEGEQGKLSSSAALKVVDTIDTETYNDEEFETASEAPTPTFRSVITTVINLHRFYFKLGVLKETPKPTDIKKTAEKWHEVLPVTKPQFIKVPPVKLGLLSRQEPPLYQKILRGLMPFAEDVHVTYNSIRDTLNTGDIVLFSSVCAAGAAIKVIGRQQFSHSALVLKPKGSDILMVWESCRNFVGKVDLGSCQIMGGTQILPLKHKIFSGYNDEVAIRRLVDLTEKEREKVHDTIMALTKKREGVKYQENLFEMVKAAYDSFDEFFSIFKNEEDISTLFCSELVANAYQEAGLLGDEKPSNEYSPDELSSHNKDFTVKMGRLEKEIYIKMKYDDLDIED